MTRRQNTRTGARAVHRGVCVEEAQLVEKAKHGETEAFEVLVRQYQDRVFNTCWRISGHLEDARDLTQEAFLKALENIAGFNYQSSFYTWLFRIAVNLALSHKRKTARRRTISLDRGIGEEGTQADALKHLIAADSEHDPVVAATKAEMQGMVARGLQALDENQRTVVVLRDLEGFDYHEIGEILGIPPGTVKSRLFRARMALHQAIDRLRTGNPKSLSQDVSD
ncbi:MAG: RNA polymerase sigma factor [Phycisphaerae bacterium]